MNGACQRACGPVEVEKMVFIQAEVDFTHFREETECRAPDVPF